MSRHFFSAPALQMLRVIGLGRRRNRLDGLERIQITEAEGVLCSTPDDPEMRPLEERLHPLRNRHERRKAKALGRM